MQRDLHQFIQELTTKLPGDLVEVDRSVDPLGELTQILQKMDSLGKYPAVRFNNVKGSKIPLIVNVNATVEKLAFVLDSSPDGMLKEYLKRENKPLLTTTVQRGPVQDVVLTGNDIDLSLLPIVKNCEKDSGKFVNSGATITRDPDLGHYNAGIYRMQVQDKNHLTVFLAGHNKLSHILAKYEERNQIMPLVCVLGQHPACTLATQSKLAFGTDAYQIMGGLLGESLELVKCKTNDLFVPACAEIVLEGRIFPKKRLPEGPYGEYSWTYGPGSNSPIFEVTAITMRNDPIYRHIFAAHREHNYTGLLAREATIYTKVKASVPSLRAVHMPFGGLCRNVAYISIKKEFDGAGRLAGLTALSGDPMLKEVVVVDENINVFDDSDVLWAISNRVQADRDIFMIPYAAGSPLDPTSYTMNSRTQRGMLVTKWAIDATRPIGVEIQERAVASEGWENIKLESYLKNQPK